MFFTAKCLKAVDEGVPRLQNYLPDGEKYSKPWHASALLIKQIIYR
jgi:hypothetical protein